jgi:crossover junction endodeoxyribonuclease RuvC
VAIQEPAVTVLGIDPGTRALGYGALDVSARTARLRSAGVIRPTASAAVPVRLGEIRGALDRLLAELSPHVVVVEEAFARHNVQSALRIGEARGVVLSCVTHAGAELVQLPPAVAKKALVGNGAAAKEQVAGMVCRLLALAEPPEPHDATDALALALAHVLRGRSPAARPAQRVVPRAART